MIEIQVKIKVSGSTKSVDLDAEIKQIADAIYQIKKAIQSDEKKDKG